MRAFSFLLCLVVASPASAEECQFDGEAVKANFEVAYKQLLQYQALAHLCAPAIGEAHAQSGVMEIQAFLARGGFSKNDAIL